MRAPRPVRSSFQPALLAFVAALGGTACSDPAPRSSDGGEEGERAGVVPEARAALPPALGRLPADTAVRVVVNGVDLTGLGYDAGTPGAPVTVVEFSDFGCAYCAKMALETKPALMAEFVDSGTVYWKYVPFVVGMFPNGDAAARAGECAAEQGRFPAMRDSLYATQRAWKGAADASPLLARLARDVGVDERRWAACFAGPGGRARTLRANQAAARLGVRATPTFFIDGQMVEGALPLNIFRGGLRQLLRGR